MQVIIITGASDGIGAEMALQLARMHKNDVALVLAARSIDKLNIVEQNCISLGAQTMVYALDISDEAACYDLIAQTVQRFGKIDILVNNAGMSAHALLADVQDLTWYRQLININLWGSAWCTHAALPYLKQSRGRIVAVSSHAGIFGVPGRSAYSASKFAMVGFFECLRIELKTDGVSVTLAYPGVVDTHIRETGYNSQGQALGVSSLKEDNAMSVEECARLIINGMNRRQREVVMTFKARVGRYLKLLIPSLVERMAQAAVAKNMKNDN